MSTTWPLTVEFDVAEPRVAADRIVVSAGGAADFTGWDMTVSSGVWCDPITRTMMLAPLCTTAAWRTTTSGSYARLAKADYTLTTPAAWVENHRIRSGNIFLEANGVNEVVRTTASYGANQPMYLNVFVSGLKELGDAVILECGWGTYGGGSTVWLRFRANGAVTIFKGSTPVAVYDTQYSVGPGTRGASKSQGGDGIPILLMPWRRRDLLIFLGTNDSVNHTFSDLDPTSTSNTITPSGSFWWYVPTGRASVQCAPVKFATSGVAYGPKVSMRYAPAVGRAVGFVSAADKVGLAGAATPNASLVVAGALTAYTPDGTTTDVRIKVAFSDDGTKTMGVYAVDAQFATTVTTTASAAVDVTQRLSELSISVDENGRTQVKMATRQSDGMTDDGVKQVEELGERPYRIALGTVDIVRGTLSPPKWVPADGSAYGIADLLQWEGQDRGQEFEDYSFASAWAYDGILLTDAVLDLIKAAGFSASDLTISTDTYQLPYTPGVSHGEWQLYPERGDTVAMWLDKLHADFAATWYRGWVPTLSGYRYRFQNPSDLSAGPHLTLYMSDGDALDAGVSTSLIASRVVRNATRWLYRSEANQILVVGQDRRTRKLIVSQYNDTASQTPGTAPASRPANWRGKTIRYQLVDPEMITDQTTADRARDILRDRLTPTRRMIEFTSDLLVRSSDDRPLWTGDVVRIYKKGRATYEDFRIRAIPSMNFLFEDTDGTRVSVREATYRGERIGTGP